MTRNRLFSLIAPVLYLGLLLSSCRAMAQPLPDIESIPVSESYIEESFFEEPIFDDFNDLLTLFALLGSLDSAFGGFEPVEDEPETESEDPTEAQRPLTPDGTATVLDNVFIPGNQLEFFTFATEADNVFFLVIDRARAEDNVFFLNSVTEQDLLALADITLTPSVSAIPDVTTPTDSEADTPTEPVPPEEIKPPKPALSKGMIYFSIAVALVVLGGAVFFFLQQRNRKMEIIPEADIYEDDDIYNDNYGDDYDDADDYEGYLFEVDDENDNTEGGEPI